MIITIPKQILYLLKLKEKAPIEETVFIDAITSSLEYLSLIMDTSKKEIVQTNKSN